MASPDAAVIVLNPLDLVVALAEAAYCMGAKDARHLCLKEVERIAEGRVIGIDGREMTGYVATTVKTFVEAIRNIEPARAMPDFTGAALVALGAPTSDGTEPEKGAVINIVAEYLAQHGYDGLYNDDCGCELSDLAPCGDLGGSCRPGYRVPCSCGDCDWHIAGTKAPAIEEDADV